MTHLFGIPLDTLTIILVVITLVIIGGVGLFAVRNAIFFRMGVRNIPRRSTQMLLIVSALLLAPTLLTGVLATGDVITAAVQTVAVSNLGKVDETIQENSSSLGFFDDWVYYRLLNHLQNDPNIGAIGAGVVENKPLIAQLCSRPVRSKITGLAPIPRSQPALLRLQWH